MFTTESAMESIITLVLTVTNDLLLVKSMYNINQWIIPNSGEYQSAKPGMYLRLSDGTKNWVI